MIDDPILSAKNFFDKLSRNLGLSQPLSNPAVVVIELTNFCNLECQLCPVDLSMMTRERKFMDPELFKKIARDIPKHTRITPVLWGESLLHKNFNEMIRYAKHDCGISRIGLSTNGT